jgi:hypothetical protein
MVWECMRPSEPRTVRLCWPSWERSAAAYEAVPLLGVCRESRNIILKTLIVAHNPKAEKSHGKNRWGTAEVIVANPQIDTRYIHSGDIEAGFSQKWTQRLADCSPDLQKSLTRHLGSVAHLQVTGIRPKHNLITTYDAKGPHSILKYMTSVQEIHLVPITYSRVPGLGRHADSWTTCVGHIGEEWDIARAFHRKFLTPGAGKTARTLPKVTLHACQLKQVLKLEELGKDLWKYQFNYADWDKAIALAAAKKMFLASRMKV